MAGQVSSDLYAELRFELWALRDAAAQVRAVVRAARLAEAWAAFKEPV